MTILCTRAVFVSFRTNVARIVNVEGRNIGQQYRSRLSNRCWKFTRSKRLYWHRALARLATPLSSGDTRETNKPFLQTSTRKLKRRVGFKAIQPRVSALRTILECRRISFSLSPFPSRISSLRFPRGSFFGNKLLSSRKETRQEERINFHENFCLSVKDEPARGQRTSVYPGAYRRNRDSAKVGQ